MLKYLGSSKQKLDDRGRFYLPQRWQEGVQAAGEMVLTAGPHGSLWLLDRPTWEQEVARIGSPLLGESDRRMLRALLVGHAEMVTADKNARVLISEALRAYAELDDVANVYLVGSGPLIEIWAWNKWDERVRAAKANPQLFDLPQRSGSVSTASETAAIRSR